MLEPIAALLIVQTKPTDYFAKCLKAHESLSAADISIRSNTATSDPKKPGSYRLVFVRPNQVSLRTQLPALGGVSASDRTFAINGYKLTAYDAKEGEKVSRNLKGTGTLDMRLSAVCGDLNDSIQAVLSPARLAAIMEPFRAAKGWTVSKEGSDVVLVRRNGANGSSLFRFDAKSYLIKRITLVVPGSTMDWSYSYGPKPKSATFTPPSGAIEVLEFVDRGAAPKYADAKARKIGDAALRAFDRLRSAHFTISRADGVSKVWYSDGRVREDLKGRSWAYNGGVLTANVDATKTRYRSRMGRSSAVDALGDNLIRATPFVRAMLQKTNPITRFMWSGISVKYVGSMSLSGVKCDILEANGFGVRSVLTLRSDNALPVIIRSETGREEKFFSELKFEYLSVNKPVDAGMFSIGVKPGYKSVSFPKPKKKGN